MKKKRFVDVVEVKTKTTKTLSNITERTLSEMFLKVK